MHLLIRYYKWQTNCNNKIKQQKVWTFKGEIKRFEGDCESVLLDHNKFTEMKLKIDKYDGLDVSYLYCKVAHAYDRQLNFVSFLIYRISIIIFAFFNIYICLNIISHIRMIITKYRQLNFESFLIYGNSLIILNLDEQR